MITSTALASVLNEERLRSSQQRYRVHSQADAEFHVIRRRIGGWLEGLGRRLQRPRHA